MAVSVNWDTGVISVPRADMTLLQSVPTEIRELNIDAFRLGLKDLEDDPIGIVYPNTHSHNPPVSVGGVSLARVIEILDPYTITFEDGQYAVNLSGANSNIADKVNVNQVSVRSANSAGLVQTSEIQYSSFQGGVTLDVLNGSAGQAYPLGTPESPTNNLADTLFIANLRGFDTIYIKGDYTFTSTDSIDNFKVYGQSTSKTTLTITDLALVTDCYIEGATIQGTLDGSTNLFKCLVLDLTYVDGRLEECEIDGTILILGTTLAKFINCYSGVAGGLLTPTIDLNGTGTDLVIRNYSGGIKFINHTSGVDEVSIDLSSGQVILDETITDGIFFIRGVGKLVNNSLPPTVVVEELVSSIYLNRTSFTNGKVYLDSSSGFSGTLFPAGTPANPVDNLTDAIAIAAANGLVGIEFTGFATATASHNLDGIAVQGGSGASNVLILAGASTVHADFSRLIITGALNGLSRINNCVLGTTGLGGMTGIEGRIVDCIINHPDGLIQNPTGVGTLFDNCAFVAPDSPQITMNANGVGFGLRECTGNILVTNKTDVENLQLHVKGAVMEFAASCTTGSIILSGSGNFTDNSAAGMTLDFDELLEPRDVHEIHGQVRRSIYIDTSAVAAGSGYQQSPYNTVTAAIDDAEANGITRLVFLADATLDRQLRNFDLSGTGNPTIDFNGQDVNRSEFHDLQLDGTMVAANGITANDCTIRNNTSGLNGKFITCGFAGNFTLAGGVSSTMVDCYSAIGGLGRPTVSINGALNVSIRSYRGGLTVDNCTNAASEVTVSLAQGKLTLAATCTAGVISVRGLGQFTDSSVGTTVDRSGLADTEEIRLAQELLESDQVFDQTAGLLHYYRKGTTDDIIPPKAVVTAITQDTSLVE